MALLLVSLALISGTASYMLAGGRAGSSNQTPPAEPSAVAVSAPDDRLPTAAPFATTTPLVQTPGPEPTTVPAPATPVPVVPSTPPPTTVPDAAPAQPTVLPTTAATAVPGAAPAPPATEIAPTALPAPPTVPAPAPTVAAAAAPTAPPKPAAQPPAPEKPAADTRLPQIEARIDDYFAALRDQDFARAQETCCTPAWRARYPLAQWERNFDGVTNLRLTNPPRYLRVEDDVVVVDTDYAFVSGGAARSFTLRWTFTQVDGEWRADLAEAFSQ